MKTIPSLAIASVLAGASAFAQVSSSPIVPDVLNYQGYLTDDNGVAIGNAGAENVELFLRVYDAPSGGNLLHAEQQAATVNNGQFSILLGDGDPVTGETNVDLDDLFNSGSSDQFHLEISVKRNGVTERITTRQRLITTPFAFRAQVSEVAQSVAAGAITSASLANNFEISNGGGIFKLASNEEADLNSATARAYLTLRSQGQANAVLDSADGDFRITAVDHSGTNLRYVFKDDGEAEFPGVLDVAGQIDARSNVYVAGDLRLGGSIREVSGDDRVEVFSPGGMTLNYDQSRGEGRIIFKKGTAVQTVLEDNDAGFEVETNQGSTSRVWQFQDDGDFLMPGAFVKQDGRWVFAREGNTNFRFDVRLNTANGNLEQRVFSPSNTSPFLFQFTPGGTFECQTLSQVSDGRLKRDVTPVGSTLQQVMSLEPVSYQFTADSQDSARHMGFIAQDVEQIWPDVVGQNGDFLSLDYTQISVATVGAVQEQQAEIEALRAENKALKKRLEAIEQKLGL